MDTNIQNKGLLRINMLHVNTPFGRFWSDLTHLERNYILIKRDVLCRSLFQTGLMYTLIPIATFCLCKITLTVHIRHFCPPTLSFSNTGASCNSKHGAWLQRTVETQVGLSEPNAGPFFKSSEFKLQRKAWKCSILMGICLQHRWQYNFFSSSFWGIRQSCSCQIWIFRLKPGRCIHMSRYSMFGYSSNNKKKTTNGWKGMVNIRKIRKVKDGSVVNLAVIWPNIVLAMNHLCWYMLQIHTSFHYCPMYK